MNSYRKNRKTKISIISMTTVSILILTGTFAWSAFQQAATGGKYDQREYVVMLLEEDYKPIYKLNNWKKTDAVQLQKPVYASSKYEEDSLVEAEYERIVQKYYSEDIGEPVFSDTWVRIKLEEIFIKNGTTETGIVNLMDTGKLVSSIGGVDGYFELVSNSVVIKNIADWTGEHGRFWILDEDGWMYWAQPVLAPTKTDLVADQETDHIIDEVKLIKQPSGIWEYTITATLDAMDVELEDYENKVAWGDVTDSEKIHQLFGKKDENGNVYINMTNFPDEKFRTYLLTGIETEIADTDNYLTSYAADSKLDATEISEITMMTLSSNEINTLKGIEHFTALTHLYASDNKLSTLDVSKNTKLIFLNVHKNNLTSLDVSKNTALTLLNVHTNNLSNLDISKNIELTNLNFNSNNLSNLDISKNIELTNLNFNSNNLSSLDVSKNIHLTHINIYSNNLSSLDVSKNEALTYLHVFDNNLSSLDVSNNEALTLLKADKNKLTSLILGAKPVLKTLYVQDNQLSSLVISDIKKEMKVSAEFKYSNQTDENGNLKTLITSTVNENTEELKWQ